AIGATGTRIPDKNVFKVQKAGNEVKLENEVQLEANDWPMDGHIGRMRVKTARCKFELTSPVGSAILATRGCSRLPREASAQNRVLRLEIRGGRSMPSNTEITTPQLSRLIGLADTPALIDVRSEDDYRADPRLLPGAYRRDYRTVSDWTHGFHGRPVIV